jgi:fatty-acyl-CoA synthase
MGELLNQSYVRGASTPPLIDLTVGALFDAAVTRAPDATALIVRHQDIRWTWAEFGHRVDRLAAGLRARGLVPGERVGIWAPNCAEWAMVQFATAKAGLILVNINPAYRTAELEYALNKVGCAALITTPADRNHDQLAMLREIGRARLPQIRLMVTIGDDMHDGFVRFADLACEDILELDRIFVKPSDIINIQFTSGTTGSPKGAALTHRNIVNNAFQVGSRIGLSAADRLCLPVPLYHCFGMVMGNLASVAHGTTIVYPAAAFDPLATLSAVAAERCTALYGVPTMFIAMLEHAEFARFDLGSLRTGIMAGSPCPVAVMESVIARMHMRKVTIAYGMTETSPVSFQSDIDDPVELRVATVGHVQPHLEVKLVDAEGEIVPLGDTGELCTRGYSVMSGYWDEPTRSADAIDGEGWMHSGDLATLDAQGYCRIVGRLKDLIIRGGENIYPREIEDHLMTHPEIVDAQVIGVPDDRYGEAICAWIILRPGMAIDEDEIRTHCQNSLARFKTPKYIRFVSEFPLTVSGKVQKAVMREIMSAE